MNQPIKLIDACRILGIGYQRVYQRMHTGELPIFREPGSSLWKISESDLPELAKKFGKDLTPAA